jgi:hypothetical protein
MQGQRVRAADLQLPVAAVAGVVDPDLAVAWSCSKFRQRCEAGLSASRWSVPRDRGCPGCAAPVAAGLRWPGPACRLWARPGQGTACRGAFDQAGIEIGGGEGLACTSRCRKPMLVASPTTWYCASARHCAGRRRHAPDDQLGDHRVVEGRDGIALAHAGSMRTAAGCVAPCGQREFHRRGAAHAGERADGGQEAFSGFSA